MRSAFKQDHALRQPFSLPSTGPAVRQGLDPWRSHTNAETLVLTGPAVISALSPSRSCSDAETLPPAGAPFRSGLDPSQGYAGAETLPPTIEQDVPPWRSYASTETLPPAVVCDVDPKTSTKSDLLRNSPFLAELLQRKPALLVSEQESSFKNHWPVHRYGRV